jgi:aspartate aminotransferase-like enzyme
VFGLERIAAALDQHPKTQLVGIVHAETSTGAHQPLEGLSDLVHKHGALLVVDTVTSLGGHEVRTDDWGIDGIYSGTQKCYGIEIGGGLGVMAGKAWRIGLMGHGATVRNVDLVLTALREILR